MNRKKIVILMYHGVTKDARSDCWWQLSVAKFKWQVEYMKENYSILSLKDLLHRLKNQEELPNNTAVITFDDGYENNYSVAYPILKQFGMPATIFLTTDFIGTDNLTWPDQLFMLFQGLSVESLDLRSVGFDVYDLRSASKHNSLERLSEQLKECPPKKRLETMALIKKELNRSGAVEFKRPDFALLSWEKIAIMSKEGLIDWGAHTCTHEILSNLEEDDLRNEIVNSCKKVFELNEQMFFAYPNGREQDFDQRAIRVLKGINAACGLSTIAGLNTTKEDIFRLKRVSIGNDLTEDYFKLLCSGVIT